MIGKRYLSAVFAASVCFVLMFAVPLFVAIWHRVSPDILISDFTILPFYLFAVFSVSAVLGAYPAFVAYDIGERFELRGLPHRLLSGAFCGVLVAIVVIVCLNFLFPVEDEFGRKIPIYAAWWRMSMLVLVSGIVGGTTYYLLEKRAPIA